MIVRIAHDRKMLKMRVENV